MESLLRSLCSLRTKTSFSVPCGTSAFAFYRFQIALCCHLMKRILSVVAAAFLVFLGPAACDRTPKTTGNEESAVADAAPAAAPTEAVPAAEPAPTQETEANKLAPEPVAPAVDRTANVIVLCYHRFEERPRDSLALSPKDFEAQLQALKDEGFSVIGMQDFLAWRRGEKSIPNKSAVITIDDGYVSGYATAWPLLKKFGYPFTMFVYTQFINAGGKSITWAQLEEMRDAGVDIQSHTVTHANLKLKGKRSDAEYEAFLRKEIAESKEILESRLGIAVNAIAYPYGVYNDLVRKISLESGYEAGFTVYGQRLTIDSPPDMLGRYAIESTKPEVFRSALKMVGGGVTTGAGSAPSAQQLAVTAMVTQPMDGETVTDARPAIKANVAAMGAVEDGTVEMRVSGLGLVPARYDAASKTVEYQPTQPLRPGTCTVILSGRVAGKKVETRWSFRVAPAAR